MVNVASMSNGLYARLRLCWVCFSYRKNLITAFCIASHDVAVRKISMNKCDGKDDIAAQTFRVSRSVVVLGNFDVRCRAVNVEC